MDHTIIFQKACDDYRLLADLTEFFPKKDRYGIGVRFENTILHLLEAIITAETTTPALKERALIEVITQAEIAAVLARLSMERDLIKETNYFFLAESFREIAKMTNGWRKSLSR
jgi:hypothetical protein